MHKALGIMLIMVIYMLTVCSIIMLC